MKRALVVSSVASMIKQFNLESIKIFKSLGYDVDVATNFDNPGTIDSNSLNDLIRELEAMSVRCFQIDFSRSISDVKKIIKSYKQLDELTKREYTVVHCHSPIGGALGRLAFRNHDTKILYTAHGFHFFSGGPIKNWLLYYPVERYLSKYTDVLFTINNEDFSLAKNFKAKTVLKIPGVGIDWKKYNTRISEDEKKALKREIGISESSKILISVGELNNNKNHILGIKSVNMLSSENIEYIICGIGKMKANLLEQAKKLGVSDKVHFLDYRNDIEKIYQICDIFLFPSKREGLGLAALEAMAAGLPIIAANVGGIKDYMVDDQTGFLIDDLDNPDEITDCIMKVINMNSERIKKISEYNQIVAKKYDKSNVNQILKECYISL